MIDDVYTHGHISRASRQSLARAGANDVALACLGLTRS